MAAIPKPDKEAIRNWLRDRRRSMAPPPPIEQIKAELFSRCRADGPHVNDKASARQQEPMLAGEPLFMNT